MPADDQRLTQIEIIPIRDYVDTRFESVDAILKVRDYIDVRISVVMAQLKEAKDGKSEALMAEVKRIDEVRDRDISNVLSFFGAQEKSAKIFSDKIDAQFKAMSDSQALYKESLQQQFNSISKATDTATAALDKRLEGMNEFREQMNDWSGKFITRNDVENTIKYLSDRVSNTEGLISKLITRDEMYVSMENVTKRLSTQESFAANLQGRMFVMGFFAALIPTAVVVVLHFIR